MVTSQLPTPYKAMELGGLKVGNLTHIGECAQPYIFSNLGRFALRTWSYMKNKVIDRSLRNTKMCEIGKSLLLETCTGFTKEKRDFQ